MPGKIEIVKYSGFTISLTPDRYDLFVKAEIEALDKPGLFNLTLTGKDRDEALDLAKVKVDQSQHILSQVSTPDELVEKGVVSKKIKNPPTPTKRYKGSDSIVRNVKENPRKKDTHGWRSWNVIEDGMTIDEFEAAGGRKKDLYWDLEKGNCSIDRS